MYHVYYSYVIASYAGKDTEKIAVGVHVKKFEAIARLAQKKLSILRAASRLEDLRVPQETVLKP